MSPSPPGALPEARRVLWAGGTAPGCRTLKAKPVMLAEQLSRVSLRVGAGGTPLAISRGTLAARGSSLHLKSKYASQRAHESWDGTCWIFPSGTYARHQPPDGAPEPPAPAGGAARLALRRLGRALGVPALRVLSRKPRGRRGRGQLRCLLLLTSTLHVVGHERERSVRHAGEGGEDGVPCRVPAGDVRAHEPVLDVRVSARPSLCVRPRGGGRAR